MYLWNSFQLTNLGKNTTAKHKHTTACCTSEKMRRIKNTIGIKQTQLMSQRWILHIILNNLTLNPLASSPSTAQQFPNGFVVSHRLQLKLPGFSPQPKSYRAPLLHLWPSELPISAISELKWMSTKAGLHLIQATCSFLPPTQLSIYTQRQGKLYSSPIYALEFPPCQLPSEIQGLLSKLMLLLSRPSVQKDDATSLKGFTNTTCNHIFCFTICKCFFSPGLKFSGKHLPPSPPFVVGAMDYCCLFYLYSTALLISIPDSTEFINTD